MIDNLYNPDSMSKEDIKTLFVARQPSLDELVSTVKNQPQGAGVQHVLIIAPRGMGKTTMLLMLQFAIEDSAELSKDWQPIRFPEESYDITELADFWLKVLHYLADATKDETLETKIKELEKRFPKSEDLREAAWATVKDWSKTNKKRIALMVDNFDMILSQINNDTEQARLRDILMNDGTVMLIGCASSYFREIQDYGQPLYNFFKVSNLSDLKFADIEELLRRRAEADDIENIEELLRKNRTRIKALEAFTGGNPRLVLMLYRIITSSDMTEVRTGLEKLLDAVTPYYKDKTEKLPPQQRKIINEIAQYSLEKREGISPTEIAQRIRMTPNQVSSQLKRLAENGYVRSLNIRGRSSFYTLSEPLYAIWSQMRFGRNAREKRNWLVQILKALYDIQEIQREIEKLDRRVRRFKLDGNESKARGTLEYLICLLETSPLVIQNNFPLAVESYLELQENSSLKQIINIGNFVDLPSALIVKLNNEKVLDREKLLLAVDKLYEEAKSNVLDIYFEAKKFFDEKNYVESNKNLDEIIKRAEIDYQNQEKEGSKNLRNLYSFFEFMGAKSYHLKGNIAIFTKDLKEANHFYNKSLNILNELLNLESNKDLVSREKAQLLLERFGYNLVDNNEEEASNNFSECIATLTEYNSVEGWLETLTSYLIGARKIVGSDIIRKVILRTESEELFFPLIRAIEYLETKDEDLIEKLSPEVRVVVEETIRTLQMVSEEKSETKPNQKVKNKKDRASEKPLALPE